MNPQTRLPRSPIMGSIAKLARDPLYSGQHLGMIDYAHHHGWFSGPGGAHDLDGDSDQNTTFVAYRGAVRWVSMNICLCHYHRRGGMPPESQSERVAIHDEPVEHSRRCQQPSRIVKGFPGLTGVVSDPDAIAPSVPLAFKTQGPVRPACDSSRSSSVLRVRVAATRTPSSEAACRSV